MRSIFIITIILFLFTACAAQPAALTAGVTTTIAPTSTLVPTETPTASATLTPESLLPPDVKEKFDQAGIDLKDMTNAKYDKNGLSITLESGEVVLLTNEELEKNIYLGQDNVLQYRDESNQNVLYAYDKETKTFLDASKYIQKDKTDPEKYIQVANWDELYALWAKEKMFLIPFDPENTYFPPLDRIYKDYSNDSFNKAYESRDIDPEFNYFTPFGILPEDTDSSFKLVNFTIMSRQDGIPFDALVISEQIFNVDDGTFSVVHFMTDDTKISHKILQEKTYNPLSFFLPRYKLHPDFINYQGPNNLKRYLENNKLISNGEIPKVRELVNKWFQEGHVPAELESILTNYMDKSLE